MRISHHRALVLLLLGQLCDYRSLDIFRIVEMGRFLRLGTQSERFFELPIKLLLDLLLIGVVLGLAVDALDQVIGQILLGS